MIYRLNKISYKDHAFFDGDHKYYKTESINSFKVAKVNITIDIKIDGVHV